MMRGKFWDSVLKATYSSTIDKEEITTVCSVNDLYEEIKARLIEDLELVKPGRE